MKLSPIVSTKQFVLPRSFSDFFCQILFLGERKSFEFLSYFEILVELENFSEKWNKTEKEGVYLKGHS